jgi:hypothetical protein
VHARSNRRTQQGPRAPGCQNLWKNGLRSEKEQKKLWALTVVPVSSVGLQVHAGCLRFGLGDDIREFMCGAPRSLLYAWRVADPLEYATCRVAVGADVGSGVLALGKHCVWCEQLPHVSVVDLVPRRSVEF